MHSPQWLMQFVSGCVRTFSLVLAPKGFGLSDQGIFVSIYPYLMGRYGEEAHKHATISANAIRKMTLRRSLENEHAELPVEIIGAIDEGFKSYRTSIDPHHEFDPSALAHEYDVTFYVARLLACHFSLSETLAMFLNPNIEQLAELHEALDTLLQGERYVFSSLSPELRAAAIQIAKLCRR